MLRGVMLAVATVGGFIIGGMESRITGVIAENTPHPTPFFALSLKL
jgi:hypothetical protein